MQATGRAAVTVTYVCGSDDDAVVAAGGLDPYYAVVAKSILRAVAPEIAAESGALNGEINLTVINFGRLLQVLGVDRMIAQAVPQATIDKLAPGLDRVMPGLGGLLRGNTGAASGGAAALGAAAVGGKPTELDGQRAISMMLRLSDGTAYLGPLKVGQIPPLFYPAMSPLVGWAKAAEAFRQGTAHVPPRQRGGETRGHASLCPPYVSTIIQTGGGPKAHCANHDRTTAQ